MPDAYAAESIPQSLTLKSDFGEYSVDVTLDGQVVRVVQCVSFSPGTYSADKAREFQDFLKKIDKESKRKAVFKLKS